MRKGHFREDLYHRLNVLPLVVPPLRQRPVEDLLDLIRHFLSELTGGRPPRVSGRALDLMMDYRWPGNVRELRNNLERAVVLSGGAGEILPEHLTPSVRGDASRSRPRAAKGWRRSRRWSAGTSPGSCTLTAATAPARRRRSR